MWVEGVGARAEACGCGWRGRRSQGGGLCVWVERVSEPGRRLEGVGGEDKGDGSAGYGLGAGWKDYWY